MEEDQGRGARAEKKFKMAEGTVVINSVENVDNPFTANGVLSKKADYIITHSTITRTELQIADPDNIPVEGEQLTQQKIGSAEAAPGDGTTHKKNGKASPSGDGAPVEVEVGKANASSSQPQHAEEVKLKSKKKCCIIQ